MKAALIVICCLASALGLWIMAASFQDDSSPARPAPSGAAATAAAAGRRQNQKFVVGLAMLAGGVFGAWIFSRR